MSKKISILSRKHVYSSIPYWKIYSCAVRYNSKHNVFWKLLSTTATYSNSANKRLYCIGNIITSRGFKVYGIYIAHSKLEQIINNNKIDS